MFDKPSLIFVLCTCEVDSGLTVPYNVCSPPAIPQRPVTTLESVESLKRGAAFRGG